MWYDGRWIVMRRKFIQFLSCLHGCLLVLLVLLSVFSLLFPDDIDRWYRCFLILIPTVFSSWGIRKIRHLAVYLGLGIGSAALLFLLSGSLAEQICLTAGAIFVFVCRIPGRLHDSRDLLDSVSVYSLILYVLLYLAGVFLDQEAFCVISYYLAFLDLIVLILHTNLASVDDFLEQNRATANLPGRQILRTNHVMMILFVAAALAGMLLLPATGLADVVSKLGDALLWLIRKLFSLIPEGTEEAAVEVTEAVVEQGMNELMALPEDKTPAWLTALYNAIAYLISGAAFLGLFAGLVLVIIRMFKQFYRPIRENNDEQEFIHEEEADISARAASVKKETPLFFRFEPDAVIRKAYKKAIKKGIRQADSRQPIPDSDTPSELEQRAMLPADDASAQLHELYEKARYSGKPCTKEDISRLKASGYK